MRLLISSYLCLVSIVLLQACNHSDAPSKPAKSDDSLAAKAEVKVSGAMQSLHFLHGARAFPHADFPGDVWYSAWQDVQQTRRQKISDQLANDGEPWEAIGPQNLGGRTLALCINPANTSTIYAGSASGGLWRTYSAGEGAAAWQRIATGYPVLAVAAIAIDPTDTNTIYIGTGEVYNPSITSGGLIDRTTRGSYGIGILKSSDAGETWSAVLDWTRESGRGVQAIRLNPSNPQEILAGTSDGLLRSTDGGSSWTMPLDVPMITDVVFNSDDPTIQFAAAGNFGSQGNGIYRSLDGGVNWQRVQHDRNNNQPNGLRPSYGGKAQLAFRPQTSANEPAEIYASIGDGSNFVVESWLIRSRDMGDSWEIVDTENANHATWQGWYSHDVSPHPTRPNDIVFAGVFPYRRFEGQVVQVGDWSLGFLNVATEPGAALGPDRYCHADCHDIVRDPQNPDKVYLATDGGIFVSDNGAADGSFRNLNGGYQVAQFYNGFSSSPQNPDLALGGLQDNYVVGYTGALGWKRMIPGDGTWTALHPTKENWMFAATQFLNVKYSKNGGETWFDNGVDADRERTAFVAPFVQKPGRPGEIYAGTNPIYSFSMVTEGFKFATPFDEPEDIPLAMAVSHQEHRKLYVSSMQESLANPIAKIYRSSDAGQNWTNVSASLPNRFALDLKVDPFDDDIVYVVYGGYGDGQLFRSSNGGLSWEDRSNGLPRIPTHAVAVDPFAPEHIYVGNEFGVWFSRDSGLNWEELFTGLPEVMHVMDLSISESDRRIRAVTHGNGVYERDLLPEVFVSVPNKKTQADFAEVEVVPSPVQDQAQIHLRLQSAATVKLTVFSVTGLLVWESAGELKLQPGDHTFPLQMRLRDGSVPAAGTHILDLRIDEKRLTKPFLFVP